MTKDKTLDYLKAFSIILVVFYHSLFSAGLGFSSMFYVCLVISLKNLHVPLFVLIAGYLCHRQDIRSFYKKKVLRILIPFLFMSCLKLVMNIFITDEFAHGDSILYQLYDAFICGNLYWYCYCLLIIFLLAPAFWKNRRIKWLLLGIFTVLNLILVYTGNEISNVFQITQTLYHIPIFVCGMLLRDYSAVERIKKGNRALILLMISLAVFALTGYFRFSMLIGNIYLIDIFMGFSLMYILYFAASFIRENKLSRVLTRIGKYSLQIMLLDSMFRVLLFALIGRIVSAGLFASIIITILTVSLSVLICEILRKIPLFSFVMGLSQIAVDRHK